jgi:hypothetical protein
MLDSTDRLPHSTPEWLLLFQPVLYLFLQRVSVKYRAALGVGLLLVEHASCRNASLTRLAHFRREVVTCDTEYWSDYAEYVFKTSQSDSNSQHDRGSAAGIERNEPSEAYLSTTGRALIN